MDDITLDIIRGIDTIKRWACALSWGICKSDHVHVLMLKIEIQGTASIVLRWTLKNRAISMTYMGLSPHQVSELDLNVSQVSIATSIILGICIIVMNGLSPVFFTQDTYGSHDGTPAIAHKTWANDIAIQHELVYIGTKETCIFAGNPQ